MTQTAPMDLGHRPDRSSQIRRSAIAFLVVLAAATIGVAIDVRQARPKLTVRSLTMPTPSLWNYSVPTWWIMPELSSTPAVRQRASRSTEPGAPRRPLASTTARTNAATDALNHYEAARAQHDRAVVPMDSDLADSVRRAETNEAARRLNREEARAAKKHPGASM